MAVLKDSLEPSLITGTPSDRPDPEPEMAAVKGRWLPVWKTPASERQLLGIIVVLGLVVFAFAARLRLLHGIPSGDEPAYLVLSQAMQKYHSLDVKQVYDNLDYRSFYPAPLDAHLVPGAGGRPQTLHQLGGPLLWLVPFMLWGRAGAVGFMVVVSVLCLVNVYYFLRERHIQAPYAFLVTMALAVGSPIYVLASMSFVEPIGALGVIFAVRAILMERLGPLRLVVASAGVAFLPWVHMRFAPLAVSLGLLLIWRVWRDVGRSSPWRYVQCVAPLALSVVLLETFTLAYYGEINPMAPQGIYGVRVFARAFHEGFAGMLFDRNYGLVVSFPLFLLVLAGVLLTLERAQLRLNFVLLVAVAPYTVLCCTSTAWWGAYSPPARYVEVIVPVLAYYIAVVLQRIDRWFATAAVVLLALGGYALALSSDIFPAERFTGWDLRNNSMERLGALVGVEYGRFAPSSFLPGQRNLFLGWWIVLLGVGVLLWFAGRWRDLVNLRTVRSTLVRPILWASAALVLALPLAAIPVWSSTDNKPSLRAASIIGVWRGDDRGEISFLDDGRFVATGLRDDVLRGSTGAVSGAGHWRIVSRGGRPSDIELNFETTDDKSEIHTARVWATKDGSTYALMFYLVDPDGRPPYGLSKVASSPSSRPS